MTAIRPVSRALATVVAVVLTALTVLVAAHAAPAAAARAAAPAASTARAGGGEAADFRSRINQLRAEKGLSQLTVDGSVEPVAARWTDHMVAAGQISHNPNLANEIPGDWSRAGENVGVGYDVPGLMQAFINSPSHYANLVDPDWTHMAVSVRFAGDGKLYTTHVFVQRGSSAPPPPAPAPAPTPTPSPSPSPSPAPTQPPPPTTTTTAPPTLPAADPGRVATVLAALRRMAA